MIKAVLDYLDKIVRLRFDDELKGNKSVIPEFVPVGHANNSIKHFIHENELSVAETIVLFTALVPHLSPEFFNNIIAEYLPNGGD
ncbi:hypothetical protein, partial [Draconibacterium sp.]|uniref:hypothetical protein n=1 Tax=Draconibacterium sp. TaxID=1965318 RepID=UPI00356A75CD